MGSDKKFKKLADFIISLVITSYKLYLQFSVNKVKMSDQALREELEQTVERVLKKLDRKTLVEGFPEVFI